MKKLLTVAALAVLSVPAAAQVVNPDRIDDRQANQEQRIREGVQSGELTRHETRRLERGQAKVRALEHRAAADGVVTEREAAQIDRAQDKQSRKITRQKTDSQHY